MKKLVLYSDSTYPLCRKSKKMVKLQRHTIIKRINPLLTIYEDSLSYLAYRVDYSRMDRIAHIKYHKLNDYCR